MPSSRTTTTTTDPDPIATALESLADLLTTYILPTLPPPLSTILSTTLSSILHVQPYLSFALSTARVGVTRLLNTYTSTPSSSSSSNNNGGSSTPELSALLSTAVLIFSLYISLRILNYVRRTVVGWIILGVKIAVFAVLVQVALYINAYGWDKFVHDASWWGGIVWGFLEDVWDQNQSQGSSNSRGRKTPRAMRSRRDQRGYGYGQGQVPGQQRAGGGRTRWT